MAGNDSFETQMRGDDLRRATENAAEYARVYLMARSRQRGCDGMGEFHALKEEFREAVTLIFEFTGVTAQTNDDTLDRIAQELAGR